jgi:hypothetical protein
MAEQANESGEKLSEIARLTTRAHDVGLAVTFWNRWYMIFVALTVVLAVGVFITQFVASRRNTELSGIQDAIIVEKDRLAKADSDDKTLQIARVQSDSDAKNAVLVARAKEADARIAEAQLGSAEANERAKKAQASLSMAEQHSAEANAKAEGFRLNIAKANESAAQAQAQVAGAMAEAAKANLELARIKAPRTLTISADTLSALRAFPGTEYTFSMAAADPESVDFLKQIDAALQSAGWKRVAPDPAPVIGMNVFGDEYRVTIGTLKGVKVEVGCAMSADELQAIPPASWPMAVKLAGGIRNAIASFTSPMSDENIHPSVEVTKGLSEVIRISVGSKP